MSMWSADCMMFHNGQQQDLQQEKPAGSLSSLFRMGIASYDHQGLSDMKQEIIDPDSGGGMPIHQQMEVSVSSSDTGTGYVSSLYSPMYDQQIYQEKQPPMISQHTLALYEKHLQNPMTEIAPSSSSPPPPPRVYKPCVVCNDRSSGYHYGVSSCEGCKGFFRRSVQKNMQYTCHKDKNCIINKVTRNRCQYCRLQKCFTMGMSKEAVRNDRNKKKKQKPDSCSQVVEGLTEEDEVLIAAIEKAHQETSPHLDDEGRVTPDEAFKDGKEVILWERVSELSSKGIVKIVEFAKKIPGFMSLSNSDQITLLKAACLEIIILRLSSNYCDTEGTMSFANGVSLTRRQVEVGGFGSLTNTIFDFSASLKSLGTDDVEFALLSAVCLMSGDRSGLQDIEKIEQMQEPILEALKHYVRQKDSSNPHLFAKLLMKLTDLRSISVKGADRVLHFRDDMPGQTVPPLVLEILDRTENVIL